MAKSPQSACPDVPVVRRGRSRPGLRSAVFVAVVVLAALKWTYSSSDAHDTSCILCGFHPGVVHIVKLAFPGTMASHDLFKKVKRVLQPLDIKPQNTIYGQSICSDEINNERGQISTMLTNYYGKVFPMGGIGGAPYVGNTGFGAFSAHVPDNGHVVVLFGPHIGFSPEGEAGKFLRIGQSAASTACRAVIAAYNQCMAPTATPDDPHDMNQNWLRNRLKPHCDDVAASKNVMEDLVLKAYKEIEKEIFTIVNTNYGRGKLVLLGGIQINMPYPTPGHFLPLHFSVRSASTEPQDLLPKLMKK